jgi:hypothetical protein
MSLRPRPAICCAPILLILSCCTAIEPPTGSAGGQSGPSELAFHATMEAAFSAELAGQTVTGFSCRPVRQLQCKSTQGEQRFRCTYRYQRDAVGSAELEPDRHGFWRWITGPKNCVSTGMS